MARTMIDIDEDLLKFAGEVLGTSTKKATVETALRMAAAKQARRRLDELIAAAGVSPEELDRQRKEEWWR